MPKPLNDELKQWEKKHKEIIRNNREKNKSKNPEKLSDRDLRELMDTSKPRYRRAKGGAWRNR